VYNAKIVILFAALSQQTNKHKLIRNAH